jgi:hypothetical protein
LAGIFEVALLSGSKDFGGQIFFEAVAEERVKSSAERTQRTVNGVRSLE